MNDGEYAVMQRRLHIADQYAGDALRARLEGNEEQVRAAEEQSRRFFEGARELINKVQGPWILALPTPEDARGFKRVFIGKDGRHVENPRDAETYRTFDEARKHSVDDRRDVYYTVEPLLYHTERFGKNQ
jgi:hypothetical protein